MKSVKSIFTVESIVLAAVLAVTLPLRMMQYYSNIEANTGFYTKTGVTVIIYYVILVAATVYFLGSAIAKFRKKKSGIILDTETVKRPGTAIICVLNVLGLFYSAYQEFTFDYTGVSQYVVTTSLSSGTKGILLYAYVIFAILSAIYFGIMAIAYFTGTNAAEKAAILSLAPVIWNMIRIAMRFTRTVSYIRVSDLLLEMLMMAAMCLFFMSFAQGNSKVNTDGCYRKIVLYGLIGAMLALQCFIPRAVLTLTGNTEAMFILSRADVSDFFIALFMVATITTRMIPEKKIITAEAEDNQ